MKKFIIITLATVYNLAKYSAFFLVGKEIKAYLWTKMEGHLLNYFADFFRLLGISY